MPAKSTRLPSCRRSPITTCLHTVPRKSFSTALLHRSSIPPQSPRYIDVPRSLQIEEIYRPFIKGVLPVPRQVTSAKPEHTNKSSPEYLDSVVPEPKPREKKSRATADPKQESYRQWRQQASALRRQNLREALVELQAREQRRIKHLARRAREGVARSRQLCDAPEREDDRLTTPTVLSSSLPQKQTQQDIQTPAVLARKRANVAEKQQAVLQKRRDLMYTLYANASKFITNETALAAAISENFDTRDHFKNLEKPGMNIWNLGLPDGLVTRDARKMGQDVKNMHGLANPKAVDEAVKNEVRMRNRVTRIAEELTGGKIK